MSNNILAWAMNTAMNSADLDAAADSHFNENDMSEDDLFGDEHESDDDMLQQNGLVRFVTNYVVEDNPTIPVMEGETDAIYPPAEEEERERSFQDLLQEEDEMELQQEHDSTPATITLNTKESENTNGTVVTGSSAISQGEQNPELQEAESVRMERVKDPNEEEKRELDSGVSALKKMVKVSKELPRDPSDCNQKPLEEMIHPSVENSIRVDEADSEKSNRSGHFLDFKCRAYRHYREPSNRNREATNRGNSCHGTLRIASAWCGSGEGAPG